jgi:type III secretion protein L
MGNFYRLTELGFALESGARHVAAEAFAPIDAAKDLLDSAEAKAAQIVKDATDVYESEKRRGYDEGREAARLEAVERLLHEQITLDNGLRKLHAELASIVVASVRKLVDGFDDVARAEAILRGALKKMREEKRVELHVSPTLYPRFRSDVAKIGEEFPQVELIDVVEDAALDGAHIVVESSIGRVDGDMGRSLEELAQLLRAAGAHAAEDAPAREAESASS